jgi:hypothetical protein
VFVHVETRRRKHVQWASTLLVVACVISFVWLALLPAPQRVSMWLEWGTVPANIFDAKLPILPQLHDPALLRLATVLKVKLAMAIIGISSIHLLATFIKAGSLSNQTIMWQILLHLTFVVSAVSLAYIDRIMQPSAKAESH